MMTQEAFLMDDAERKKYRRQAWLHALILMVAATGLAGAAVGGRDWIRWEWSHKVVIYKCADCNFSPHKTVPNEYDMRGDLLQCKSCMAKLRVTGPNGRRRGQRPIFATELIEPSDGQPSERAAAEQPDA